MVSARRAPWDGALVKPQESALEQPFQHRDRPEVAVNCLIAHASQSDPKRPPGVLGSRHSPNQLLAIKGDSRASRIAWDDPSLNYIFDPQ